MSKLEYQDGLGDLLQEKEPRSFGINKILSIASILILIIFLCLFAFLSLGKWFLTKSSSTQKLPNQVLIDMEKIESELSVTANELPAEETKAVEKKEKPIPIKAIPPQQEKKHLPPKKVSPPLPKKSPAQTSSKNTTFKVLAGFYDNPVTLKSDQAKLYSLQIPSFTWIYTDDSKYGKKTVLQVGAFASEETANQLVKFLNKKGFSGVIIKR